MRPRFIILATIALNAALFVANLSVALLSGSRTVLSQAIYTLTDLVGGLFLLWGLYVSRRPPDHEHPFGFGKERFFWAFVSTVVTFTAAGIVALVEGIDQLVAPIPVTHLGEGVFVVGATLAASVVGIWVTLRELRIARQTLQTLLESSNQGLKSIFYQDLVTIYGSVIAFAGLLIVYRTSDYWVDGAVAAFEGLLLVVTGLVLTAESREYLIGRALAPEVAREMLGLVERDARVTRVRSLQSMQLGPDDALLALRINFQDGLTTDQLESAIDQVTLTLKAAYPILRHVIIEPES
ncbi:MAG: cation diffusion facilitator family transporter [Thermoplasmata archaeon]|nr:cation diffusion facilitator family transporter [Thermoplasmata archaeon]